MRGSSSSVWCASVFQIGDAARDRPDGVGAGLHFPRDDQISSAARVLARMRISKRSSRARHHRVLLVLFSAILTLATQSSTAAIGLALALGESGAASLPSCCRGAWRKFGSCLTSLVAGLGTWEAAGSPPQSRAQAHRHRDLLLCYAP